MREREDEMTEFLSGAAGMAGAAVFTFLFVANLFDHLDERTAAKAAADAI